jgi:hypothetical protein
MNLTFKVINGIEEQLDGKNNSMFPQIMEYYKNPSIENMYDMIRANYSSNIWVEDPTPAFLNYHKLYWS